MESTPGKQSRRQAARRAAAQAQATLMRARLERDRRCAALGVQVVAALRERDALVQRYERQAGEALRALVVDEAVGAPRRRSGAPGRSPPGRSPACAASPKGPPTTAPVSHRRAGATHRPQPTGRTCAIHTSTPRPSVPRAEAHREGPP